MPKAVYSKKAVVLAKKLDGNWWPLACVEEMTHNSVKGVVEEVGLNTGNWEQWGYTGGRDWTVTMSGITLLADVVDGAWTIAEIDAAMATNDRLMLKLVVQDESGELLQMEQAALLQELGFGAAAGDGAQPAKWNSTLQGCGPLEAVAETGEWLWSSGIDMLWPGGAIIDLYRH